jgi:photosystem II reaction center protein PsbP
MRLLLTVMSLSFAHWGFCQPDKSSQSTTVVKENFRIEYPKSWTLDTSGLVGSKLFVLSALENDSDKFRENVSVIIQNLAGQNIDLDKYKDISETQIGNLGASGKIFESSKVEAAKGDYYKLRYALNQGNFKLVITSYCYIKNDEAYLITFTSESDKYNQYKEIGDKILDSFQFTK